VEFRHAGKQKAARRRLSNSNLMIEAQAAIDRCRPKQVNIEF